MCGICGIVGPGGGRDISPMVRAMRHRGPDDGGQLLAPGLSLGMARLAILDLSERGAQPMANAARDVWLVYNGELYNHQAERSRLEARGVRFRSTSDTEVVLALYEELGEAFLARLRGMFALALYDRRGGPGRERLLLARDHLGVKPLLYARAGGDLVFASELKALLASGLVERRADPESLRLLLCLGSVPQPRTAVAGVEMLPAGCLLSVQGGRATLARWWDLGLDRVPGLRAAPYPEQVEAVRAALEESARLQMQSEVPLGAFLSGGVDSSILAALLSGLVSHRLKTFSVGFGQEGRDIDESAEATATARLLGTDHTVLRVEGPEVRDSLLDMARALDQPSVDGVNSYMVSRAARRAVTVAVSGTGGDELFAGYPWFAGMVLWQEGLARRPGGPLRRALRQGLRLAVLRDACNPLALGRLAENIEGLRRESGFAARFAREYFIFDTPGAARLLSAQARGQARPGRETSRDGHYGLEPGGLPPWSPVERVTALCLRGYTQNQLLRDIDAVSMAHSLEVRVPFLDHVLLDTVLSLPDATKLGPAALLADPAAVTYRQRGIKRILVDAFRHLLPPDMDDQAKRGFAMPFGAWLSGPLAGHLADALSPDSVARGGLFDPAAVAALLEDFRLGRSTWAHPWLVLMTELWRREVLLAPAPPPGPLRTVDLRQEPGHA